MNRRYFMCQIIKANVNDLVIPNKINKNILAEKNVSEYDLIIKKVSEMPDIYLKFPCIDLLCKHITKQTSDYEKEHQYLLDSITTNANCIWGIYNGKTDIMHHLNIIRKMESDGFENSVRIVKHVTDKGEYLWCDNLHSLIRYMNKAKKVSVKVTLEDIPFYVVEFNELFKYIQITGKTETLSDNIDDVLGAVVAGIKRVTRVSEEIYLRPYKIKDFLKSNPILYAYI